MNNFIVLSVGIALSSIVTVMWYFYKNYLNFEFIPDRDSKAHRVDSESASSYIVRPDPHTTTRVYFDTLSGVNETRSYFVNESQIDDINLNPNDNHNVHNITVVNAVKSKLPILYNTDGQKLSFVETISEIKTKLQLSSDKTRYPYIMRVLRFILNSRAKYSSKKIREFEIMRLIWSRINHPKNEKEKDLLVEEFLNQLNSCYETEKSQVCCLEGRIVRYFQVLELYDYESDFWRLTPLWAFKTEIETTCANELNKMVENLSLNNQMVYFKQNPSESEQILVNNWNNTLINNLKEQFNNLYLHKLGDQQLNALTEPCFAAIVG